MYEAWNPSLQEWVWRERLDLWYWVLHVYMAFTDRDFTWVERYQDDPGSPNDGKTQTILSFRMEESNMHPSSITVTVTTRYFCVPVLHHQTAITKSVQQLNVIFVGEVTMIIFMNWSLINNNSYYLTIYI